MPLIHGWKPRLDRRYRAWKAMQQQREHLIDAIPNLITNGTFDTDMSGWVTSFYFWEAPGHAKATHLTTSSLVQNGLDMADGDSMHLILYAHLAVNAVVYVRLGGGNIAAINGPVDGYVQYDLVADGNSISFFSAMDAAGDILLDNIFLRHSLEDE